jgi:dihydrofolate synthase/folylpolyglutamate synthase
VTYDEALQSLYSLRKFGMKLGLDRIRCLARRAGDPDRGLRFIHVAGTNGKGSTCAFLESLYRRAGFRVGLFTSPHLVHFGERIQVNRVPVSEAQILELVRDLDLLRKSLSEDEQPTMFEAVTLMALLHFSRVGCDVVVWETGLGGRLDATNIVHPVATLITSIGLDHPQWLGSTLEEIAAEKAGIFKRGVPALCSEVSAGPRAVITAAAAAVGAPLAWVGPEAADRPPLQGLTLPLAGEHQRLNAALAVETVRLLQPVLAVPEELLSEGLRSTSWPGRMQEVTQPGRTFILDGAHNEEGCAALAKHIQARFGDLRPALILGILADKSCEPMLRHLLPVVSRVAAVTVQNERSLPSGDLARLCRLHTPPIVVDEASSLPEALRAFAGEPRVVVAGSLYLVGEALEALGLAGGSTDAGRRLSEAHFPLPPPQPGSYRPPG